MSTYQLLQGVGSFSTLGTTVVLGARDAVVNTGLHARIPIPFFVKDTVKVFCIDHRPSDDKTRKRESKPLKEDPKLQQSIRELVVAGKGAMGLSGRGNPEVNSSQVYVGGAGFLEMCKSPYEFLYGYGVLVWWRGSSPTSKESGIYSESNRNSNKVISSTFSRSVFEAYCANSIHSRFLTTMNLTSFASTLKFASIFLSFMLFAAFTTYAVPISSSSSEYIHLRLCSIYRLSMLTRLRQVAPRAGWHNGNRDGMESLSTRRTISELIIPVPIISDAVDVQARGTSSCGLMFLCSKLRKAKVTITFVEPTYPPHNSYTMPSLDSQKALNEKIRNLVNAAKNELDLKSYRGFYFDFDPRWNGFNPYYISDDVEAQILLNFDRDSKCGVGQSRIDTCLAMVDWKRNSERAMIFRRSDDELLFEKK
ncbi:hypothetical protein F5050DRAFT_1715031 [Lentinula boryana]|uniref:Uncharacterized protein n=1 Tax=Lentinula boryana TaxID=40481 RepID=A0ABQ8Q314_9AGAR|nr:hypothetical protein F5050DRAFT_1715031 [Lentinula boryana]